MKSQKITNAPGSNGNGKRAAVSSRARRPLATAGWKASTAVLIAQSAVPRVSKAAGNRARAVRVFLIEDNRLQRDGLTAMLSAQGLKVIATARTGVEALRLVGRLDPDLVLLSSALGDRDTLRLVTAIRKASPSLKLIVMHLVPGHEDMVEFVRAGVSGFIMKDASAAEFVDTIRSVAGGANVLPPLMAGSLFSHVADRDVARTKTGANGSNRMTKREREVTALIAKGLGNKEIGVHLRIAPHTVKSHVHKILAKLALNTRLEVAAHAHANGGRRTP